jgi:DNA-binding winged helix-turn-helix (wHTH) protein/TolB-like protein/Tfp pilus assembly protein PilF
VLRKGDREESPEPQVFDFLMALASRDGDLVSKDQLIDEVWNGVPASDDRITQKASQLRGILGDKARNPDYIQTLNKQGYRLIKNVEPIAQPDQKEVKPARPQRTWSMRRLWLVAAVVIAVILGSWIINQPGLGKVESIAVLPFENSSGDPADQYLVSGFKLELVQTLHNVPKLAVKHGRVAYPDKEARDIADILGVDAVLFGGLQRVSDVLKVSYFVTRHTDGKIISSGEVTGGVDDVFAMQARLAVLVRNDLVGESRQQLITDGRTPNSDAYDRYMRGLDALERRGRGRPDNLDAAISLFEEAIQLDPGFGPAYLSLATAYALLPDYNNAPLEEMHGRALEVIERGIIADNSLADSTGAVEGFVYHKQKEWTKAETAYRRATTANVVDSNAFNWYSLMLSGVGRLDDALEQVLVAQKIDPSSTVINARLGMVYTWLGESEKAAEFFDRASLLDASEEIHMLGRTLLYARQGELDQAASAFGAGVSMAGHDTEWIGPLFAALEDPSATEAALSAIETAFSDPQMDPRFNIIVRAVLGDTDGAMRVAHELADSGAFFEMDFLFMPELRPFRAHENFLPLIEKFGIRRYWDENNCTWQDDTLSC